MKSGRFYISALLFLILFLVKNIFANEVNLISNLEKEVEKKENLDQAKYINELYYALGDQTKMAAFAIRKLEITDPFLNIKPLLDRVVLLKRISNSDTFLKACQKLPAVDSRDVFSKTFKSRFERYCHSQIVSLLTKQQHSAINKKEIVDYIIQYQNEISEINSNIITKIGDWISKNKFNTAITKELKSSPFFSQISENAKIQANIKEVRKVFYTFYDEVTDLAEMNHPASLLNEKVRNFHHFYDQNKESLSNDYTWSKFYYLGKKLTLYGYYESSEMALKKAIEVSDHSTFFDSIFQVAWLHIVKGEFKDVTELISKYKLNNFALNIPAQLLYWIGYSYERLNNAAEAKNYYKKIIDESPLTYYAVLATDRMTNNKDFNSLVHIIRSLKEPSYNLTSLKQNDFQKEFFNTILRILSWVRVNNETMVNLEVSSLLSRNSTEIFDNEVIAKSTDLLSFRRELTCMLIGYFHDTNMFLSSFKLATLSNRDNTMPLNSRTVSSLFPRPYQEVFNKVDTSLDSDLVLSLVRQESAFNPSAQSSVGAMGLMQIMPNTAKTIKKSVKKYDLFKKDTNVEIGSRYLKKLLQKYDGNLVYALSAYNAGEHRANKWIEQIFKSHPVVYSIEMIPFTETNNYVKLIIRNLYFYKILGQVSTIEDTSTLSPLELVLKH